MESLTLSGFVEILTFTLSGFVGILRESLKIWGKNGKLMAPLTFIALSIYSICYLSNVFSIKPIITDMFIKQSLLPITDPKSPEFFLLLTGLKKDLKIFVELEWIYLIISTFVSLFFVTAIIIAAAMVHGNRNLSFKELLLSTVKSLKRTFFTWFYTTLLGLGYVFLVSAFLLPTVFLVVEHPVAAKVLAIILVILALVLLIYLAVIWYLAFVVSVLEDKSGVEAFGKASQIVKGMQLHGFLLNLLFTILAVVPHEGITLTKASKEFPIIVGLLLLNFICLTRMFLFTAYTVFYYQCKKTHGEEVDLQWNTGYTIVTTLTIP